MPIGIILNSSAVFFGGLIGSLLGKRLKKDFCDNLTLIFGACSMAMGISSITKMVNMPPVIFAVLFGTLFGELLHVERGIERAASYIRVPIARILKTDTKEDDNTFMAEFISIVVLFCASGTGIFGSLQAGISGDNTILISKAVLDLFTAAIFATSLEFIVMTIAVPQFMIMMLLFICARFIMPYVSPEMLSDFTACGGILMLATGFRIAGIKRFPTANMIPAMILVMPLSALWVSLFS